MPPLHCLTLTKELNDIFPSQFQMPIKTTISASPSWKGYRVFKSKLKICGKSAAQLFKFNIGMASEIENHLKETLDDTKKKKI